MNIKMNKVISEIKSVKNLYIAPTGTDESLSIGACYYLNRFKNNLPLQNIYLGQKISKNQLTLAELKFLLNDNKNLKLSKKLIIST